MNVLKIWRCVLIGRGVYVGEVKQGGVVKLAIMTLKVTRLQCDQELLS